MSILIGVWAREETECDFLRSQCMPSSVCMAIGGHSAPGLCGDATPSTYECCYTDYDPTTERDPLASRCYTPELFVFDCGNAFHEGIDLGPQLCVCIDERPVSLRVASAFRAMREHASVSFVVTSSFRVMSEQEYFYRCYRIKENFGVVVCNDGNLAARPGYSNHQNGIAMDIETSAYEWMRVNAHKYLFVRTVDIEKWHWEFRPEAPSCDTFVDYSCQGRNKCETTSGIPGECVDESLCKIPAPVGSGSCPLDPDHVTCCEEFVDLKGYPKLL